MSEWMQMALTPPEALQLTIKVGVIPETDHVQVQAELADPLTSVQIAMWSVPHGRVDHVWELLEQACQKGRTFLEEAIEPF